MNEELPSVERVAPDIKNLESLARLRMSVFREWPYLYKGDLRYEELYLKDFLSDSRAVIILASLGGIPVGMATASPLASQPESFTAPLKQAGIDVAEGFYFGESVLLARYRGLGLGHRFFDEREAAAREVGAKFALFCAVNREADHPSRPRDARNLEGFWRRRGYHPLAGVEGHIDWAELGEIHAISHSMTFWQRQL